MITALSDDVARERREPVVRQQVVLEARGLMKSFGATHALVDGTLAVHQGEVLALLGENGSGKSTLVKLLSGILTPDGGTIAIDGTAVRMRSPRRALVSGIVTVFQEILVAPDLSVVDNLWLGNGSPVRSRRRDALRRARAAALLDILTPDAPSLDAIVRDLDLMQRQVCVVARALLRNPRVLVLDESTSTLDVTLRDRLFDELRARCADGMAAIFISHRMDEVMTFADRFVALRAGSTVGELGRDGATHDGLIRLISGDIDQERRSAPMRPLGNREPGIQIRGLAVKPGAPELDLDVQRGEILGLGGLEGHGQDTLLRVLAGLTPPHAGTVEYVRSGVPIRPRSYREAVRAGVAYVPRDRKTEGLADLLSIIDNFALPTQRRDTFAGVLIPARSRARFARDALRVNLTAGARLAAGRLSGGNQQKLILARWLATEPTVLLLNDPTRGVDLRTKRELYDVFRGLAELGVTIVLLSTEVEELAGLAERVVVYHAGRPVLLTGEDITCEGLISAYFGGDGSVRGAA